MNVLDGREKFVIFSVLSKQTTEVNLLPALSSMLKNPLLPPTKRKKSTVIIEFFLKVIQQTVLNKFATHSRSVKERKESIVI